MDDGHINILCGNLENAWQTKEIEGSTTGLQDELVRGDKQGRFTEAKVQQLAHEG